MKPKSTSKRRSTNFASFLLTVLFAAVTAFSSYAQQPMERVYASSQTNNDGLLTDVNNAGQAVDGDKDTHSTMTITVLGTVWQQLRFAGSTPSATDPVHIKLGTSTGLLNLLDDVTLQAYNGNTPVGNSHTMGDILLGLGLLNGADQTELVLPAPGVPYNGVRITYNGVALGGGIDIYEAFYYVPAAGPVVCNTAADVIWGSDGSLAGGINGVEDAANAIDGDPGTAALLRSNVGALNEVHLTVLYNTLFPAGDFLRFTLRRQDGGLLDAGVLSTAFHLRAYNDNTLITEIDGTSGLLRLQLLPGSSDAAYVTIPVDQPFNRAEIAISSGLVGGALEGMYLHEVKPLAANPIIAGLADGILESCPGENITLTVTNPEAGATYAWYPDSTTTAPLATGTSYDLGALSTGTYEYYVSFTRGACTDESSARAKVTVIVNPSAVATDITANDVATCIGTAAVLTPTTTLTNPVFAWYKDANKAEPITDGLTEGAVSYAIDAAGVLTVTGLDADATYYVSVAGDEKCENAAGELKAVNVTVTPAASAADINVNDITICDEETVELTPSSTITNPDYKWYRNPDRTDPILNATNDGDITYQIDGNGVLTINGLLADNIYTYYVSVTGEGKCENVAGALRAVIVTVTHQPDQPIIELTE